MRSGRPISSREHVNLTLEMSLQPSAAAGVRDRLVLGYHGVSDAVSSQLIVSTAALRRQLVNLLDSGYVGMTFNRAVLHPSASLRLAVTFDDGERSVLEHAFPVLSELGIPGSVFVPVGVMASSDRTGKACSSTFRSPSSNVTASRSEAEGSSTARLNVIPT